MALTASYPLVLPARTAEPAGEVMRSTAATTHQGYSVVVNALQGLYLNKVGPMIWDSGTYSDSTTDWPVTYYWCRSPRLIDGTIMPVLMYFLRLLANPATLTITVTNITTGAAVANAVTVGTGWWAFPTPPGWDSSVGYNLYKVEAAGGGVGGAWALSEALMLPDPSQVAMLPGIALDGAVPQDSTRHAYLAGANPDSMRSASLTAVAAWNQAPVQVLSLGMNGVTRFALHAENANDGTYYIMWEGIIPVPQAAGDLTIWVSDAGAAAGNLRVTLADRSEVTAIPLAINTVTLAAPHAVAGQQAILRIESTRALRWISAYWEPSVWEDQL